jgi:2-polyprenyl-3-methyl-5-hydroxy-6-metoxy-1,4-benzoquinol methylase
MNPKLALEKMKAIYRSPAYWNEMSYGVYLASEHIRLKNALRNWRFASRFLPQSGRLLDIGCATGFFGAVAHQHAYEVVGIDPAEELVDFGRRKYGLDLRTATIEEAFFDPASFDVVSLWGTDSHFYDVRAGFTKIADWLRPGGHFLFSYQNYAHWIRFFFPQIKQAANVYYNLTKTSCHLLMQQLGLDILAERTAIQTTQLHRLARTLGVGKTAWPRLESLKITLPTISYKIIVARKR